MKIFIFYSTCFLIKDSNYNKENFDYEVEDDDDAKLAREQFKKYLRDEEN